MNKGIKIQALIYKFVEDKIYCLCLKRSINDGGFWHVITGTKEDNESDEQVINREIYEELNLDKDIIISNLTNIWDWNKNGEIFEVREYFINLKNNSQEIILNEEHDEYAWLTPENAYNLLEKDSAKSMVKKLMYSYLYE